MRARLLFLYLAGLLLLCSCSGPTPAAGLPPTAAPTVTSPLPSPTPSTRPTATSRPRPTRYPTASPRPTLIPLATAAPVGGYWLQNTTQDGLCTDSPRFVPFREKFVLNGEGSTICFFDYYGPEHWTEDYPDPLFDFFHWSTVDIPGLRQIVGGWSWSRQGTSRQTTFFGAGGQCTIGDDASCKCSSSEGVPFADIRAYGFSSAQEATFLEWFMSPERIATIGRQPQELSFSIPDLAGDSSARGTWLSAPYSVRESVWVGTNGYGVLRIDQSTGQVTRYTTVDGLPDNTIRDIQVWGDNFVWAATPSGVGFWNGRQWRSYTTSDGLPSDDVRGVSTTWLNGPYGTENRAVWAATGNGPALLALGWERWQTFPDFPAGIELSGVMDYAFATRGQGLLLFIDAPLLQGQLHIWSSTDGLPGGRITALAATDSGVLAGTSSGAAEWDGQSWQMITSAAVNDAVSTTLGAEDGLWLRQANGWTRVTAEPVRAVAAGGWYATAGQVCRWDEGTPLCPPPDDGQALRGVQVLVSGPETGTLLAIDGQGQYWLYQLGENSFSPFSDTVYLDGIVPQQVQDVAFSPQRWYYATRRGIYEGEFNEAFPGSPIVYGGAIGGSGPIDVRDLSLNDGAVWAATAQGAFYSAGLQEQKWSYVAGLPSHDLTAVAAVDGGAWFGTVDGRVLYFEHSP